MITLEKKINGLPPGLQREVNDFVEYLLLKNKFVKKKKPNLGWIGGLEEFKDKYTSIELQKKSLEWRD